MSHTQEAAQAEPGDARIIEERHVVDPHGDDEIEAVDDQHRHWHRPDLTRFNSRWWMAVGWLIVILLVVFPFPWWW